MAVILEKDINAIFVAAVKLISVIIVEKTTKIQNMINIKKNA